MHTIISISFSPFYLFPLILIFSIVGRTLLFRVRHFFSYTNYVWQGTHPAVLSGIWLYGITGGVIVLSSSTLICRIHAIIILSFMLQMAVTDAVSGLLPA
ncbi:prepilin peptidase, partial [Salmonella enterica]